jgi:putative SOS response-associated peptidase YedK
VCGRYTSTTPRDQLSKLFEALVTDRECDPSFSVSPTSDVYVVLDYGEARKVDMLRWGFVPSWSKDLKIGAALIGGRRAQRLLRRIDRLCRWTTGSLGRPYHRRHS